MEFAFTRKIIRRRYETVVLRRLIEIRISGNNGNVWVDD